MKLKKLLIVMAVTALAVGFSLSALATVNALAAIVRDELDETTMATLDSSFCAITCDNGGFLSLPDRAFKQRGHITELTKTSITTTARCVPSISPAVIPYCATTRATSPRAIMPKPTIRLSCMLNLNILEVSPQPKILPIITAATTASANRRISALKPSKEICIPV